MKVKYIIKACLAGIAICVISCVSSIYFMQYNKPSVANAAFISDGEAVIIAQLKEINRTLTNMSNIQAKIWEPRYSNGNSVFESIMSSTAKAIYTQNDFMPATTSYYSK